MLPAEVSSNGLVRGSSSLVYGNGGGRLSDDRWWKHFEEVAITLGLGGIAVAVPPALPAVAVGSVLWKVKQFSELVVSVATVRSGAGRVYAGWLACKVDVAVCGTMARLS